MLDLIVIGVAIALDPLPLIPFILLLTSRRGTLKGGAFLLGWFLCLAAITAGTLLITGGTPPGSGSVPTTAGLVVRIVIGAALVGYGLWRRSRAGLPPKVRTQSSWERKVDDMSPWFAMALAPITQPWGLMAAGVTAVMAADLASAASVVGLILFVLLASSTYLVLEAFALFRPDRAQHVAGRLRHWIESHTPAALTWGSLAIGLFLVVSGAVQLA